MKKTMIIGPLLLAMIVLSPQAASAQPPAWFEYQYAVKVIDGVSGRIPLAPGRYRTAVNVYSDTYDTLFMRIVIAEPTEAGRMVDLGVAGMSEDQALEIDCSEIKAQVENETGLEIRLLKGFLILESLYEKEVVAVYTAGGLCRKVSSLDIERIPPRKQPAD